MARLGVNYRIRTGRSPSGSYTDQLKKTQNAFANLIVDDVLLKFADRAYAAARTELETGISTAIKAEIATMAGYILKYVVQPERATGPSGHIKLASAGTTDQIADISRRLFGGAGTRGFNLQDSDAYWDERDYRYVRKKKNKEWWYKTGQFKRELAQPGIYTKAFGPVLVKFTRSNTRTAPEGLSPTRSGLKGNNQKSLQLGKISVQTFGNITSSMLPSLASGNVENATPTSNYGLSSLFPEGHIRNVLGTLSHEKGNYRPVLEPFVSYYLTRAIPNAVYRRVEQQFGRSISNQLKSR